MNFKTVQRKLASFILAVITSMNTATISAIAVDISKDELIERAEVEVGYNEDLLSVVRTENLFPTMSRLIATNSDKELKELIEETKKKIESTYVVQADDTIWEIAVKYYGCGYMYRYIMEMNDMETSDVYEGMELDISIDEDQLQEKVEFYTEQEAEAKRKIEEEKKRAEEEAARKAAEEAAQAKSNMTYVGKFKITGYDAWCYHCNGSTSGLTASGNVAVVGRTVAASSKYFALGTKIYIEGYGEYVVEDRGAFKSNVIDVATSSHSECYNLTGSADVYIIE